MLNVVVHIVVVVRGFAIPFVMVVVIFLPLSNCPLFDHRRVPIPLK